MKAFDLQNGYALGRVRAGLVSLARYWSHPHGDTHGDADLGEPISVIAAHWSADRVGSRSSPPSVNSRRRLLRNRPSLLALPGYCTGSR